MRFSHQFEDETSAVCHRDDVIADLFLIGRAPGPTFMVQRGREAVVRFINHSDRETSVHLHGSYSRAPFDGWADYTALVGQYKDYCKCKMGP